jgi:energy-coupling factor transporter transmembrane protein EcfT
VQGCSPSALLLASALALVGSAQVDDLRSGVAMVAAELLLAPLAVRRVPDALRRAAPGLVAALSLGASSWWLAGNPPETAVVAGLRILALVLPGALLAAWVDPSRLGDELAQWLRLPPRPVVAAVAALQQLDSLGEQWRTLDRVLHVRGLGPGRSPVARVRHVGSLTFALLVQTLRRSGRMAVAMDARGFAGATRRTWAQPPVWRRRDTALVVVLLAVGAVPLLV